MACQLTPAMALITASIIMLHSAAAWEQPVHALRHHVTAGAPMDQLFQHGVLGIRQFSQTCPYATETVCPDGNGCCPDGSPCAYTTSSGTTVGICEGFCPLSAATCTTPITACCPRVGETCGSDGLCTAAPGSVFQPPLSSGPPVPQSSFQGPATTPVSTSAGAFGSSYPAPETAIGASQSTACTSHLPSTKISGSSADTSHSSPIAPASNAQATGSQASVSTAVTTGGATAPLKVTMGWFAVLVAGIVCNAQQL